MAQNKLAVVFAGLVTAGLLAAMQRQWVMGAMDGSLFFFANLAAGLLWSALVGVGGCFLRGLYSLGFFFVFYGLSCCVTPLFGIPESVRAGWGFQILAALIALGVGAGVLAGCRSASIPDSDDRP